ncbi:putative F-box protein At1g60370 [Papaver somniferum]|uniref:putative F-box protein At1g60370 n=1 Tax=Papaver somniferum TaxID=3469 RepID=UPI000E6FDF30|nr:putative F-box protein At1g60370 [Papaver somniferum]XP_026448681.1 putative F-box protein At1g60370 [Papaver somniferum]XP_026448682.1 putative F-box protein At1g60370 [Papaver somniferum]
MEYFDLLPEDITLDIISRVPTESVLECKLVSKTWRRLIGRPSFSKKHVYYLNHPAANSGNSGFIVFTLFGTNFRYFEYNENQESTPIERIRRMKFSSPFHGRAICLGSCNGLICVYEISCFDGKSYICNPITREYIMIPEIKRVRINHEASGFGYVSSTNQYKLVTIISEPGCIQVYIYTLGRGNERRNLGKFKVETGACWQDGTFVNAALYWWDYQIQSIFTFNLASENFCEQLSPPPLSDSDFGAYCKLGVLDGCLSFANDKHVNGADCLDVWLLRKKNENQGMEEQAGHQSLDWIEAFMVYGPNMFAAMNDMFAVTKNNTVLTYSRFHRHINIHDLEASSSKTIVDLEEGFTQIFSHKNTLVSLKELGGEDTNTIESVEIEISLSTSCLMESVKIEETE